MRVVSLGPAFKRKMCRTVALRPALALVLMLSLVVTLLLYLCTAVPGVSQDLVRAALEDCARDSRYVNVYRRPDRLPADFKYLLLWSAPDIEPIVALGMGQRAFLAQNCSVANCYVTTDRDLFDGDLTRFDAILFDGRHVANMKSSDLPRVRHPRQLYLYFNSESADNYPACDDGFDNFFNMSVTYRLDSDVSFPYFMVKDARGRVVGPKADMRWAPPARALSSQLASRIKDKKRAAAWFVSNCRSRSKREEFVGRLQEALKPHDLQVDVYGNCGSYKCPRTSEAECDEKVRRDYYFYMALENSLSEDYVTEKVLRAASYDAVPVVLGGAQYERFLPPGSYLNAGQLSTEALAERIVQAMQSPAYYSRYFRWHDQYSWTNEHIADNVCEVCAALHSPRTSNERYVHFRRWWHPDYEQRCGIKSSSSPL